MKLDITEYTEHLAEILDPQELTDQEKARFMELSRWASNIGADDPEFPREEYGALLTKRDPKWIYTNRKKGRNKKP